MEDITQLYQDTILSHNRNPRNFGKPEQYSHTAIGRNPLCGDSYQLFVQIDGERIIDICFHGEGCAVSKASASIMSEFVKGSSLSEADMLKNHFLKLLLSEGELQQESLSKLPRKLQVFRGVSEYPMRVKCATLIWRALETILQTPPGENLATMAISTE